MAKKKKNEQLPEGMSRRQAKLAARAAERAALASDPRPYKSLPAEAQLVALQEFVPSAVATATINGIEINIVTVLPGAVAALVREAELGGQRFVALQVRNHSNNPARDLAYVLNWALNAAPGSTLDSAVADGNQPEIASLLGDVTLEITEYQDFFWWLPEDTELTPEMAQSLRTANNSVMPSFPIPNDDAGSAWWIDAGEKAHIRWVRTDDEEPLLRALARVGAAGNLHLGEETKFAGVFRTHGLIVPVFDLDPTVPHQEFIPAMQTLNGYINEQLGNDEQLTPAERRQLENIKSRQVTIR
ncbi:preprotein translocase subunit SecA [Corynebacterium canis]|uniref:Preprotein translocase subunit SecA n=1 Tax=Corynebacterium canis TaxID=679663 RepID=A0A5C5U9J5_9CORY|nr:DUF5926 family protein [Corynebacterium canis]TWT22734.1 preprotein translocase subunit SecA [Corynebacterium canis]WJY76450.1 hypothetical protein CCANI_13225 [Corynebacterium canis]